ncbi:hypothetical protein CASFOL_030838 [Castilleja foliolosa]|uniref:Uncharacterized protein n=1 Tax=Castilleja foliolosa TaxID=1961234 RepID=A0ABD3C7I0_9LAMI
MNTIRLKCLQLVNVAFLGTKAHGHISLFTSQYKITFRCLLAANAKTGRLRREDIRHTNFDHAFSKWKLHMTQSLPKSPGLYEFGIPCKFSSRVIVVYVGQSQNLRMSSKRSAEEIEDELLRIYDYAWNKRCNGDRRPDDIHKKLESQATKSCFSSLVKMIRQYFDQIKNRHPFVHPNIQNNASFDRLGIKGIWSTIFGISKKWLRQVGRSGSGSNDKYSSTNICGPVSAKLPVDGKKRCSETEKST